jgi:hypothetical protein
MIARGPVRSPGAHRFDAADETDILSDETRST